MTDEEPPAADDDEDDRHEEVVEGRDVVAQVRNLTGEDEVGHRSDAGDDDQLAEEEQEVDHPVEDDHAKDVSHQPGNRSKTGIKILTVVVSPVAK